jgi:tetratricopeptide (TPR) repeat protein
LAFSFRSSGDLSADRRYEYARALAEEKDHGAAADLFGQILELVPDWLPALSGLAIALADSGRHAEAVPVLRRLCSLDPADEHGAGLRLATLGDAPVPPAPPGAYVRGLFDAFAARFDEALVGALGYAVPGLLAALVDRLRPRRRARPRPRPRLRHRPDGRAPPPTRGFARGRRPLAGDGGEGPRPRHLRRPRGR